ncbi:MAG: SCO family protein [Cytophagaceae bacterium]
MKPLIIIWIFCLGLLSCKKKEEMKKLPTNSIFHLTSQWQDQHNKTYPLESLRGKTLVVVMIYTTCQAACPILISDMKKIEQKINPSYLDHTSFILVSIDPETDTPEHLAHFADLNKMTASHWVFLRSNEESTQEFANVLAMKYKKISPIDFSHSNIISVFNPEGEMIMQEEGTRINTDKIAETVNTLAKD